MMRCLWLFCGGAMALILAGCAGYRLGPTNGAVAGARTVQIVPFVNKTLKPELSDYIMNSLRKNLQQDGTYRIETQDDGDIILSGVVTAYQRSELALQPADVLTVLDYQITMTAQITARERTTGKIIFSKAVNGRTSLQAGNDLTSAERQAIPLMTDDLAKKTTALLVDGTW
jgi:Lipopolysaccharide-assembly